MKKLSRNPPAMVAAAFTSSTDSLFYQQHHKLLVRFLPSPASALDFSPLGPSWLYFM